MRAPAMIVTGASAGIGRALVLRAAGAGFSVLAVARRGELLAELARAAETTPGEIAPLAADVGEPGSAQRIVAAAMHRFGRINILVNNAGAVAVGPITAQSDAALREQFVTHVTGPLALVREALAALRATHGHVFFIGSGVARVPTTGLGAYPAAKAAIRVAARIARAELRSDGIAVTYVDPGAVDTDFMRRAGMEGAPKGLTVPPDLVARKIVAALASRQGVLNVVPWQAPLLTLAEMLPGLTDFVLSHAPSIVGTRTFEVTPIVELPAAEIAPPTDAAPAAASPAPVEASGGDETQEAAAAGIDEALAPLANRMARLKLSRAFVKGLLEPGASLEAGDVALRWAGMPNKNERALTNEVLEALAAAGFLTPAGDDAYRVSDVERAAP